MLENYRHVRDWVDELPKLGRSSFSLDEAIARFSPMPKANVRNALHRLTVAGKVRSVWRGFYAIVLPEYGISGDVPPSEYIDQLMAYTGTDYYVALLSAASYQGSSHQSPQNYQVMTNRQTRPNVASGSLLEFVYKKKMPGRCIEQKAVKSGCINVSAPALTALDLVAYPSRSGGISHVATVLAELADSIDFEALDAELLSGEPRAVIQRLGHLLETSLDEVDLADILYEKCALAKLSFSRTNLITGQQGRSIGFDSRWKVSVNYDVEVEE